MHSGLYLLLAACLYAEPVVIVQLGARCYSPSGYGEATVDDLLVRLLEPVYWALTEHTAVAALLQVIYYGAFWLLLGSALYRYKTGRQGSLFLPELVVLLVFSAALHLVSCTDSGPQNAPVALNSPWLDALFSPTNPVPNAIFAPRLAWSALLLRARQPGVAAAVGVSTASLLLGLLLRHIDTRVWVFSLCLAWCLAAPSPAPLAPPSRATRRRRLSDKHTPDPLPGGVGGAQPLFTLADDDQQQHTTTSTSQPDDDDDDDELDDDTGVYFHHNHAPRGDDDVEEELTRQQPPHHPSHHPAGLVVVELAAAAAPQPPRLDPPPRAATPLPPPL